MGHPAFCQDESQPHHSLWREHSSLPAEHPTQLWAHTCPSPLSLSLQWTQEGDRDREGRSPEKWGRGLPVTFPGAGDEQGSCVLLKEPAAVGDGPAQAGHGEGASHIGPPWLVPSATVPRSHPQNTAPQSPPSGTEQEGASVPQTTQTPSPLGGGWRGPSLGVTPFSPGRAQFLRRPQGGTRILQMVAPGVEAGGAPRRQQPPPQPSSQTESQRPEQEGH